MSTRSYPLTPNDSLVITIGSFTARFPSGCVDRDVTVKVGEVGRLTSNPPDATLTGDVWRLELQDSDVRLTKDVTIQLPFTGPDDPELRVLRNTLIPQYPDPYPWTPDDSRYTQGRSWQPKRKASTRVANARAGTTRELGSFSVGK